MKKGSNSQFKPISEDTIANLAIIFWESQQQSKRFAELLSIEQSESIIDCKKNMKVKYKDGDILVSDSKKIITVLKGDYNNGKFRDYVCIDPEGININPTGVWDGVTDWRLATVKEKEKLYKVIESRRLKAERDLEAITELQKLIQH